MEEDMRRTCDSCAVPNPAACVCTLYTYIYREGGRVSVSLCVHIERGREDECESVCSFTMPVSCVSKYVQQRRSNEEEEEEEGAGENHTQNAPRWGRCPI